MPTRTRAHRSALLLALLLGALGCAARRPVATIPFRVGTSGDYPPFSIRAADGTFGGFDVAVARAYATARGLRLELVPFRWPELASRLAAGDFDVAMSGVTVRGDRLLSGTMTAAVARADAVLLVRSGEEATAEHDGPERRIAVNLGGHLERVARAHFEHATIQTVEDNRQLPVLLRDRAVDGIVTDTLEAATFDPGAFVVATRLARDRKAYWVAPGREALAADLDAWLLASEQDGTLAELRRVHLPAATAPPLPPALAPVADLAARRLLLMPLVAAAKQRAKIRLVDRARETAVIEQSAERARAAGLDPGTARALALTQIAAARAVQLATKPPPAGSAAAEEPSLETLRSAIDAVDGALMRALVAARGTPTDRGALTYALRADAELPGLEEEHARAIAAALERMLQSPPIAP